MKFWPIARKTFVWTAGILVMLVAVAATYKLHKTISRAANLGLWPKEPSLESLDPTERIDAAREAARTYGGKT
jgi:hypothetical protein